MVEESGVLVHMGIIVTDFGIEPSAHNFTFVPPSLISKSIIVSEIIIQDTVVELTSLQAAYSL